MDQYQSGILAPVPNMSRYMAFTLAHGMEPQQGLQTLHEIVDGNTTIVGIGQSLLRAIGKNIPGMRTFPALTGPGLEIPSTPAALWCWCRGEILYRSCRIQQV